jgi:hypothetical protein
MQTTLNSIEIRSCSPTLERNKLGFFCSTLLKELFGGTHGCNLFVNGPKVHKFAVTLEFFRESEGSSAPLLRTTGLRACGPFIIKWQYLK